MVATYNFGSVYMRSTCVIPYSLALNRFLISLLSYLRLIPFTNPLLVLNGFGL